MACNSKRRKFALTYKPSGSHLPTEVGVPVDLIRILNAVVIYHSKWPTSHLHNLQLKYSEKIQLQDWLGPSVIGSVSQLQAQT